MKTAIECLPCYLRQALRVARISTDDIHKQLQAVREVARITTEIDMEKTPPENSVAVYRAIAEITGCLDPYIDIKQESNRQALKTLSKLEEIIAASDDSLAVTLRLAIGGNIIDYGAMHSFDVTTAMEHCLHCDYVLDDSVRLLERLRNLHKGATVLYLADNSGEIVYDSLLVRELAAMGLMVVVAVKSGAIINDALLGDALACGLDQYAEIIENGTSCPGTPLDVCSDEFREVFASADLIMSKGQGNFETLSEAEAEIFFMLTVKCPVVGMHLAEISQTSGDRLAGDGGMVIYYHNGKGNG